jgi:hypothetical protein
MAALSSTRRASPPSLRSLVRADVRDIRANLARPVVAFAFRKFALVPHSPAIRLGLFLLP